MLNLSELQDFLLSIDDLKTTSLERAISLLWWINQSDPTAHFCTSEMCIQFEDLGHPKQNVSRLDKQLKADSRAVKVGKNGWRLHPKARRELDSKYASILALPTLLPKTGSVLPDGLFVHSRQYIERVVDQLNKAYDCGLWDCCAVMCRRLLETLIIETYETAQRSNEIKGRDNQFLMLNGLIAYIGADPTINLGRNASKGLADFKVLGDLSAHNRRFNARKDDIDRVRDGLRIVSEELLHLAGFTVAP